ncbi:hypothetical protein OMAG_001363 [Candidatus Omnitrophus magneticus]|uniref:Uncharacterized protein n=1 Tax=Candidatus Omnitrophus magneticus TaxID=1609969 RepID=A0A0F0CTA6_9BACT|nr:hypothetical protein OMAG_001363 [Candidatus Omnitrophus magneticus]
MKKQLLSCLKFIIFLLVFHPIIAGAGIRVSPGAFCIQNVEIGVDLDLGIDLTITNDSDSQKSFIVESIKPSLVKKNWLKGYSEIPNPKWLYFEKNYITVPPYSSGKTRIHIKIPNDRKYYNQHWIVYARVSLDQQNEMFNVELKPSYLIETMPNSDHMAETTGVIAVTPSIIKMDASMGNQKSFIISNNDNEIHEYRIYQYIPLRGEQKKQSIIASSGCVLSDDNFFLKFKEEKFKLFPKETRKFFVGINPDKNAASLDKNREAILMIESENGVSTFVRVEEERRG